MILNNLILLEQDVSNSKEAISLLVNHLKEVGAIKNKERFEASVWQREDDISTSVGYGIAMPHGKDDSVTEAFIAYLRPRKSFVWDTDGDNKVNSIFMIGVPETGGERAHLKMISSLSKKLIHETFRNELLNAKDVNEAYQILKKIEEKEI